MKLRIVSFIQAVELGNNTSISAPISNSQPRICQEGTYTAELNPWPTSCLLNNTGNKQCVHSFLSGSSSSILGIENNYIHRRLFAPIKFPFIPNTFSIQMLFHLQFQHFNKWHKAHFNKQHRVLFRTISSRINVTGKSSVCSHQHLEGLISKLSSWPFTSA